MVVDARPVAAMPPRVLLGDTVDPRKLLERFPVGHDNYPIGPHGRVGAQGDLAVLPGGFTHHLESLSRRPIGIAHVVRWSLSVGGRVSGRCNQASTGS